jgi:hypothetical protein
MTVHFRFCPPCRIKTHPHDTIEGADTEWDEMMEEMNPAVRLVEVGTVNIEQLSMSNEKENRDGRENGD